MKSRSDIGRVQGDDQFGGSPMNLGLALQVLWKSASSRLDHRLRCLRLVPLAHGQDGCILAPPEFRGDLAVRHERFLSELRLCSLDDP